MSAETILKISDLDISFRTNAGVVHAIRGVDMDLQKGETGVFWTATPSLTAARSCTAGPEMKTRR